MARRIENRKAALLRVIRCQLECLVGRCLLAALSPALACFRRSRLLCFGCLCRWICGAGCAPWRCPGACAGARWRGSPWPWRLVCAGRWRLLSGRFGRALAVASRSVRGGSRVSARCVSSVGSLRSGVSCCCSAVELRCGLSVSRPGAIRFRLCQVWRCCGSFCVVDWRPLLGFFGLSLVPRRVRYRGPSLSVLLAAACVVDEVSASMNCTKRSQKSGSY